MVAAVIALVVTHLPAGPGRPVAAASLPSVPHVALPNTDAVFDVAVAAQGRWVLKADSLSLVDGSRVVRSATLGWLHAPADSSPRLMVDAAAHRIWVVLINAAPALMAEFDDRTLRPLRIVTWRQLVQSAVAYAGHLYVTTDFGVADLRPGGRVPRFVTGLAGAVGALAVDPTRHRLIAIDLGYPSNVWTFRPGRAPVESKTLLYLTKGSMTVVNGAIWVGGFATSGAVLYRLDPRTFRPVVHTRPPLFGPGVVVVGDGRRVLWIAPGGLAPLLACASARTGRIEQTWQVADVRGVVSDAHGVVVATPTGTRSLATKRCEG